MKTESAKYTENPPCAVITGASSGLGRELANIFSKKGYHLILSGRNRKELQTTVHFSRTNPARFSLVTGDLRDKEIITRTAAFADLYNASLLITAAGIYDNRKFSELPRSSIDDILQTNLISTVQLVRAIYTTFLRRRSGMIININSAAGKTAPIDEPVYCSSKHGLTGFFKSLRLEGRQKNIRILDVFLSALRTPMMIHRADYSKLISPNEMANIIFEIAALNIATAQIEELHIGRFQF